MGASRELLRRLSRSGLSASSTVSTEELLRVHRSFNWNLDEPAGPARGPSAPGSPAHDMGRKPLANITSSFSAREIFANTELHMDAIKVIGFDYDFTLASYTNEVQRFIYSSARDVLVDEKLYPAELSAIEYDKTFAIRGLTFDKERGLLFKLGPNFKVDLSTVFRGRRRLDEDEALAALGGMAHVRRAPGSDSLVGIFDQFSLAEACLLADVCEFLHREQISFSPAAVFEDVTKSIGKVHLTGQMHREVMSDVERYLHRSPKLRQLLEELGESGVDTFVLSNSSFDYIDVGMRYLCGDDWMELFRATLTEAHKPSFYQSRNPFRKVALDQGATGQRRLEWSPVTSIERMCAYSHGNVTDLMKMTGWRGPEVLYIGDHVFADLRTPARFHGWWTGAIIRELEKEIAVERTEEFQQLKFQLQLVEEIMRRLQWSAPSPGTDSLTDILNEVEADRRRLRKHMSGLIHPNFGSVFTSSANNTSLFATSIERYVDVYTSRLENLVDYGPGASYRFYPRRRRTLAHEPPAPPVTEYLEASLNRRVDRRDVGLRPELSFVLEDDDSDDESEPSR